MLEESESDSTTKTLVLDFYLHLLQKNSMISDLCLSPRISSR